MWYSLSRSLIAMILGIAVAGLVGSVSAQTNLGRVSIDNVTGLISPSFLNAGSTHQVAIRYNFIDMPGPNAYQTANAFELYSPDGANWVNLLGTDGPIVIALPGSVNRFRKYYTSSDNGVTYTQTGNSGMDQPGGSTGVNSRVAYSFAALDFTGQEGFWGGAEGDNGIALYLQFQSLLADAGKTLCVDSTRAAGTVLWEWANTSLPDRPLWDNGLGESAPRCWEILACPNMPPPWCNGTVGNVAFSYCREGSYQLCAGGTCWPNVEYALAPPFDDGNYGSLDPISGLWTWSGPTVPQGALLDIQFQVLSYGSPSNELFTLHVEIADWGCDCCDGRVGDANHSGEDEPTIGDVTMIIDHLFISRPGFDCYREADINQSGGLDPWWDDVTIGDVTILIDYLFIGGPDAVTLPACL